VQLTLVEPTADSLPGVAIVADYAGADGSDLVAAVLRLMNLRIRDGILGGAGLAFAISPRSHYGLPSRTWLKRK